MDGLQKCSFNHYIYFTYALLSLILIRVEGEQLHFKGQSTCQTSLGFGGNASMVVDNDNATCSQTEVHTDHSYPGWTGDLGGNYYIDHVNISLPRYLQFETGNSTNLMDIGLHFGNSDYLVFEVQACQSPRVYLFATNDTTQLSMGRGIGIGEDSNFIIRSCGALNCTVANRGPRHGAVDCNKPMPFWISWNDGVIRAGKGLEPYVKEKLSWEDPSPINVSHIFITTCCGFSGQWKIYTNTVQQFSVGIVSADGCPEAEFAGVQFTPCAKFDGIPSPTPVPLTLQCEACGRYIGVTAIEQTKILALCDVAVHGWSADSDSYCSANMTTTTPVADSSSSLVTEAPDAGIDDVKRAPVDEDHGNQSPASDSCCSANMTTTTPVADSSSSLVTAAPDAGIDGVKRAPVDEEQGNQSPASGSEASGEDLLPQQQFQAAVENVFIGNNSPKQRLAEVNFVVMMKEFNDYLVTIIDYGDSSHQEVIPVLGETLPSWLSAGDLLFSPEDYYKVMVNHTYINVGVYQAVLSITFTTTNSDGSPLTMQFNTTTDVYIQSTFCPLPSVTVSGGGENSTSSMLFYRHQTVKLQASIIITCPAADQAAYEWSIHKLDTTQTLPNEGNKLPQASGISSVKTQIQVSPFTLDYGLFVFQLEVTIPTDSNGSHVSNVGYSWITVIPSTLRALINGGTAKVIGIDTVISMDASGSSDLDLPSSAIDNDMSYTWFCTVQDQTLPEDPMNAVFPESGGCFGSGQKLLQSSSDFEFQGSDLEFDLFPTVYIFHLYVGKPDRDNVTTSQTITMVSGDPPIISITCVSNCAEKINPSQRLVLRSSCSNCNVTQSVMYEWGFNASDPSYSIQSLSWDSQTTTGRTSANLVIKTGVFTSLVEEEYTILLTATKTDMAEGSASYMISTNTPPSAGECSVSPTSGVVLETMFTISCAGFIDSNLPLSYEARKIPCGAQTGESKLLQHGYSEVFPPMYLPLGDPLEGHAVCIEVTVKDSYGAGTAKLVTAVVEETDIGFTNLQNLTRGDDSVLSHLVNAGDGQQVTQFITSLTSVLNSQLDYTGMTAEEVTQQVQQKKEIRDSLIDSLAATEVESVETLLQTAASLTQVTEVSDELSTTAQTNAANALLGMSQYLVSQSASADENIKEAGHALLSGVDNMMVAVFDSAGADASDNGTDLEHIDQRTNVTKASLTALTGIKVALSSGTIPGEAPVVMEAKTMVIQLSNQLSSGLPGSTIDVIGSDPSRPAVVIDIPSSFDMGSVPAEMMSEVIQFEKNPFSWSDTSQSVNSEVTDFVLKNGSASFSVSDLPVPIDIYIPSGSSNELLWSYINVSSADTVLVNFNVTNVDSAVLLFLYPVDAFEEPLNEHDIGYITVTLYSVYLNDTTSNETIANTTYGVEDVVQVYNTTYGIRLYNTTRSLYYLSNCTLAAPLTVLLRPDMWSDGSEYSLVIGVVNTTLQLPLAYATVSTQCLFWEEDTEQWAGTGCQVGQMSQPSHLHCQCTHLTSFGGGLFVMPNKLNFKEDLAMFLQFWDNPVGIVVVVTVLVVYMLLWQWAIRNDRIDVMKALPIELIDNNSSDSNIYVLTVYTGSRRGAGTSSDVFFMLSGTGGQSDPHRLSCVDFPVLQRGDTNVFLLRTPRSLGVITSMHLWLHTTGDDPSWFVARATVYDHQTASTHHFVCKSWLSLDMGECTLDKEFMVANEDDIKDFENVFFTNTVSGLNDKHLWFSIIGRPAQSQFSRVQRLSCCLSLIMTYMLGNIMFYGIDPEPGEQTLDMGPFTITWTELRIGLQTSLLMFPANFLIAWLFQRIRPRHPPDSPWRQELDFDMDKTIGEVNRHSAHKPDQTLKEGGQTDLLQPSKPSKRIVNLAIKSKFGSSKQAALNVVVQDEDFLAEINKRKHLLKMFKGDSSSSPDNAPTPKLLKAMQMGLAHVSTESEKPPLAQREGHEFSLKENQPKLGDNVNALLKSKIRKYKLGQLSGRTNNTPNPLNDEDNNSLEFGPGQDISSNNPMNHQNDVPAKKEENSQVVENKGAIKQSIDSLSKYVSSQVNCIKKDSLEMAQEGKMLSSSITSTHQSVSRQDNEEPDKDQNHHIQPDQGEYQPKKAEVEDQVSASVSIRGIRRSPRLLERAGQTVPADSQTLDHLGRSPDKPSYKFPAERQVTSSADEHHEAGRNKMDQSSDSFKSISDATPTVSCISIPVISHKSQESGSMHSAWSSYHKTTEADMKEVYMTEDTKSLPEESVSSTEICILPSFDKAEQDWVTGSPEVEELRAEDVQIQMEVSLSAKSLEMKNSSDATPKVSLSSREISILPSFEKPEQDWIIGYPEVEELRAEDVQIQLEDSLSAKSLEKKNNRKVRSSWMLPWWCICLPWLLVALITAVCAFFTILYTFNYGLKTSLKWMNSLILSFFADVFVEQPMKVIGFALFVAVILKRPADVDPPSDTVLESNVDDNESKESKEDLITLLRLDPRYNPPTKTAMAGARSHKETERKMFAILVEIIRYIMFMYLVLLIAYMQRDQNIYLLNQNINHMLFHSNFDKTGDLPGVWSWLQGPMLEAMYSGTGNMEAFMINDITYRIGEPVLRQLRVKSGVCFGPSVASGIPCRSSYSSQYQDDGCYNRTWDFLLDADSCELNGLQTGPWAYQTGAQMSSRSVSGSLHSYRGGFVAMLGHTKSSAVVVLQDLFDAHWIDSHSAAVVLEAALYTANVNLITLVTVMFEIPPYGGVISNKVTKSMKLYRSAQGLHIFVIVLEALYVFYTLYFMVYEIRKIKELKKQYFKDPWNFLELACIIVSLLVVALYIAHAVEVDKAIGAYRQSQKQDFHNVLVLDQFMNYLFGALVTLGMIKFLHLLRFNPIIFHLSCIVRKATPGIAITAVLLTMFFIGFSSMMSIMAGFKIAIFKSPMTGVKSLYLALLGTTDWSTIAEFHPFWGPLLMLSVTFFALFVILNLMIILLIHALTEVQQNSQPSEDAELLWLLYDKIKQWVGLKQNPDEFIERTW